MIHDAGWETYAAPLAVLQDNFDALAPCFTEFVPVVQQAVVDYAAAPDRANAMIIDAVATFDSFWVYDQGVADYAVATMDELGLHGNGPDSTVGNMDEARIQKVIDDAIQAHGGGGVSDDFGLARSYAGMRTLRLADGPDEVHRRTIARLELKRQAEQAGIDLKKGR